MRLFFTLYWLLILTQLNAQQIDSTVVSLETVVVKAYEQSRKLKDVPAAVNYINRRLLERFSATSIVQAVNTTPGIRMEERSPGSYRLNIRGSSLRSPFGVRNVKIYYNDIPLTDPGGQTYFNNLGYYNFGSLEIIKGPGSSLYGAGTGGVLLVESLESNEPPGATGTYTTGSFGLHNIYTSVNTSLAEYKNKFGFQHQQSEGYRIHSKMERNIVSWNGRYSLQGKNLLKATFLYSQLFYETPGALTRLEYDANPRSARPAGGGFPGAEQSKASIQQQLVLAGASYSHQFSTAFSNTSVAYGMFTELKNPAIRNYGKNVDPHVGGRTVFNYKKPVSGGLLQLIAGAEFQQSFSTISVYKNNSGSQDSLQTLDETPTRQTMGFLQASFEIKGWELTAGSSLNFLDISIKRSFPNPIAEQKRNFTNEIAPRVALAKKWKQVTVYTSVAKGFSPPTSSELFPSGSIINLLLEAEQGINYDIGIRAVLKDISLDMNAFNFSLQNAIVQRRDAGGGDYFINAGKTRQKGIETSVNYPLANILSFARQGVFWLSHTWHHFRYKEFRQLSTDHSGKKLPGTAPHTISTGLDFTTPHGLTANVNYYYSGAIPLNDGNTAYADPYHLVNARLGFGKWITNKWQFQLGGGIENLLDQKYSLGNDVNGFGGRYFNAAPGRNFHISLAVNFAGKQLSN